MVYAYNGTLHQIRLGRSELLRNAEIGGRRYGDLIQSDFDTTNRATGVTTAFQVTYGTRDGLAEIPVHAIYQPRWWLEVQLFLDDQARF